MIPVLSFLSLLVLSPPFLFPLARALRWRFSLLLYIFFFLQNLGNKIITRGDIGLDNRHEKDGSSNGMVLVRLYYRNIHRRSLRDYFLRVRVHFSMNSLVGF